MKSSVSQNATVDKIQGYETKIAKLTAEFKSMQIAFDDSQKELAVEKKKVIEHKRKIVEQEDRIASLEQEKIENNKIFKNKDKTINKLQLELRVKNTNNQQRYDQLKKLHPKQIQKQYKKLIEASKKIDEKLRAREEQKLREEQEEQRKISEKQSKLKYKKYINHKIEKNYQYLQIQKQQLKVEYGKNQLIQHKVK